MTAPVPRLREATFDDLYRPLLAWAFEKCCKEGLDLIDDPGCSLEYVTGRKVAPYRRRAAFDLFVYKARTPELAERLESVHAWQPSPYDGDAC